MARSCKDRSKENKSKIIFEEAKIFKQETRLKKTLEFDCQKIMFNDSWIM